MADRIQTTPRNKLLGLLADSLSGAYDYAQRPDPTMPMGRANPVLGLLADALPLKAGANVLDDLSYGQMPLRGTGMTTRLTPDATELAMAAAPFPKTSGKAALAALGAVDHGALNKAAIVWHGSPHRFDRFDASKIGTGEGAQAYGHGLYFAESPSVATSYKELVQRDPTRLMVDGKVVSPDTMYGRAAEDVARIGVKATLQKIDDNIRFNEKYAPDMAAQYRSLRTKVEALDPARVNLKEGSLYKVDLPDNMIARMLDWDRPFSQQAPEVRKALQDAEVVGRDDWLISGMRGREAYNRAKFGAPVKLPLNQADDQIYAAERLRQAGIPGIRYLDQGSRNISQQVKTAMDGLAYWNKMGDPEKIAQAERVLANAKKMNGFGTSNFVVFPGEENALTILERNGRGLLD